MQYAKYSVLLEAFPYSYHQFFQGVSAIPLFWFIYGFKSNFAVWWWVDHKKTQTVLEMPVNWRSFICSFFSNSYASITQHHRTIEVLGVLWDCLVQYLKQLEQVAQDHGQFGFGYLRTHLHNLSGHLDPVFDLPHSKKAFFLCADGASCMLIWAHCLLAHHWASLRRVCLPLCHCLLSDVYTYGYDPLEHPLARLNSRSSLSLPSREKFSIPQSSSRTIAGPASCLSGTAEPRTGSQKHQRCLLCSLQDTYSWTIT